MMGVVVVAGLRFWVSHLRKTRMLRPPEVVLSDFVWGPGGLSLGLHGPWIQKLGWVLLHSLWESSLVLLGLAVLLRLPVLGLARATSRFRYLACAFAMLLFVALPLRRVLIPSSRNQSVAAAEASGAHRQPAKPGNHVRPLGDVSITRRMDPVLPWVVLAWFMGMVIFLLRLLGGWLWLQRLRWKKAELADTALQGVLMDLCRRAHLKRAVTLLTCEGLQGPSVVGFLRPAILVPAGWFLHLPPDHLEALLAHELAHVLRHDYVFNLLQSLLEVVFFYHPGIWWLSRRIRQERELACDAFASRLTGDPLPLAEALTALEARHPVQPLQLAPAAHGGLLMQRIQHLLLPAPQASSAPMLGAVAMLMVLLSGMHLTGRESLVRPIPETNTGLMIRFFHEKDRNSQSIQGQYKVDLVGNEVSVEQVWTSFMESYQMAIKTGREISVSSEREQGQETPKITLDFTQAQPEEILATLHHVAEKNGVKLGLSEDDKNRKIMTRIYSNVEKKRNRNKRSMEDILQDLDKEFGDLKGPKID